MTPPNTASDSFSALGNTIINASGSALSEEDCDGWIAAVRSKLSAK